MNLRRGRGRWESHVAEIDNTPLSYPTESQIVPSDSARKSARLATGARTICRPGAHPGVIFALTGLVPPVCDAEAGEFRNAPSHVEATCARSGAPSESI